MDFFSTKIFFNKNYLVAKNGPTCASHMMDEYPVRGYVHVSRMKYEK